MKNLFLKLMLTSFIVLSGCSDDDARLENLTALFEIDGDFVVDEDKQIQFTDLSKGLPFRREWTFEGGSPSTSTEKNPEVTYPEPGIYEVSLKVFGLEETSIIKKEIVVVPTRGLLAFYPFSGNAQDESDNSFNGTLSPGLSLFKDRNDKEDQSYKFNGVNDSIITSTEIDQNLSEGATFSAWIYITANDGTHRILSNYNGTGAGGSCNERIGFVFGLIEGGQLNVFYAVDSDDLTGRATLDAELETEKWYHVAATWNGTYDPSGFKLYIDGIQSDQRNFERGTVNCDEFQESERPFQIGMGSCFDGPCHPFDGAIDEVRIYNRPLSANEITILSKS